MSRRSEDGHVCLPPDWGRACPDHLEALPKPLVKSTAERSSTIGLDRLAESGVERAIVNVHWLADQIERT
jgi:hypothetical protein